MKAPLIQTKVFLPPGLADELASRARRLNLSKSELVRIALTAWLLPETAERPDDALARRLDRISRALERLAHRQLISNEAHALFIRAWLSTSPPIPEAAKAAYEATGLERYRSFLDALGRRMADGMALERDLARHGAAPPNGPA